VCMIWLLLVVWLTLCFCMWAILKVGADAEERWEQRRQEGES